MSYRQFDLVTGKTHLRTWLEDDRRLKIGARLTLKGDSDIWTITARWPQVVDEPPAKDWKVGGLV